MTETLLKMDANLPNNHNWGRWEVPFLMSLVRGNSLNVTNIPKPYFLIYEKIQEFKKREKKKRAKSADDLRLKMPSSKQNYFCNKISLVWTNQNWILFSLVLRDFFFNVRYQTSKEGLCHLRAELPSGGNCEWLEWNSSFTSLGQIQNRSAVCLKFFWHICRVEDVSGCNINKEEN